MDRVPPEVWEMIFKQLKCPDDYHSTSRASSVWRNYLGPSMPVWMFDEAFPLLLPYLSKTDVLNCRAVCKQWKSGVDHFLENHAVHRPVITNEDGNIDDNRIDQRVTKLHRTLHSKNLLYLCTPSPTQIERMLEDNRNHPNYQIVGKSVFLLASYDNEASNRKFLKVFGSRIHFLHITISGLTYFDPLYDTVSLLEGRSSLKKVEIDGIVEGPEGCAFPSDPDVLVDLEYNDCLPELETLQLNIQGINHEQLNDYILHRTVSENMTSLSMNSIWDFSELGEAKIYDLELELDSEYQFQRMLTIGTDLRRLSLNCCGRVKAETLFGAVREYRQSIRNFELTLKPEFYGDRESTSARDLGVYLEKFSDREILEDIPNLKRVTLKGCRPLSLNFLCGLKNGLENLHLSMTNLGKWDKILEPVAKQLEFTEELDLLDILKQLSTDNDSRLVYKSNVWTFFPNLKILTVSFPNDFGQDDATELQYSRAVYDKMTSVVM